MTKREALHELTVYLHDLRESARREGYKVDRAQTWEMMVQGWVDAEEISAETGRNWLATGPRAGG